MEDWFLRSMYAFGIPILMLFINSGGKILINGCVKSEYFYFGLELALTAFSSCAFLGIDLMTDFIQGKASPDSSSFLKISFLFVAVIFYLAVFVLVLIFHQHYEKRNIDDFWCRIILNGLCNVLGILALASFVGLLKGF